MSTAILHATKKLWPLSMFNWWSLSDASSGESASLYQDVPKGTALFPVNLFKEARLCMTADLT